jgi:hypothetical protein
MSTFAGRNDAIAMREARYVEEQLPHPYLEADFDMSNPFAADILKNGLKVA